jgi:hypothetical protein
LNSSLKTDSGIVKDFAKHGAGAEKRAAQEKMA